MLTALALGLLPLVEGRFTTASASDGWLVVGSQCFGYQPDSSRTEPQGYFQLFLHDPSPTAYNIDDLFFYVFDSEPGNWGGALQLPCPQRGSLSKTAPQHVRFNSSGVWETAVDTIHQRAATRMWYFVVANCERINNLQYDMRFQNTGFFDEGSGPDQCIVYDRSNTEHSLQAAVAIFVIATIVLLLLFLRQWWKNRETAKLKQHAPPGFA